MHADRRDAFGAALAAHHAGEGEPCVIERDDGYVDVDPANDYFWPVRRWPAHERSAIRRAKGRVLDVGAGAGRVALHLQDRGHDVTAIDVSPGAVEVMRARGVRDARAMSVEQVGPEDGPFDTVVLFGNNLGLLRDARHGPWLLRRLGRATSATARILGGNLDVSRTEDPAHLAYQTENRARGRLPGQIRIRVRYGTMATPWFDYLFQPVADLEAMAASAGWRLVDVIWHPKGPEYVAVLEKA